MKERRLHLISPGNSYRISWCGLLMPVDDEDRRVMSAHADLVPRGEGLVWAIAIPSRDVAVIVCNACATELVRRAHAETELLRKLDGEGRLR